MFTREPVESQISPKEQYYSDSLLTKPSSLHSMLDNFSESIVTPFAAAVDMKNLFSQKAEGNMLRDLSESVKLSNSTPNIGWTQQGADFLASMVGFGVNPINWGFGRVGSIAAEGLTAGVAKAAPEAATIFARKPLQEVLGEKVGKYIPNVGVNKDIPLSLAILGKKGTESFGFLAGAAVPTALYENYNTDTKHIAWGGVAGDMSKMGAFGLAIGSVPFAFGVIKARVNRARGVNASENVALEQYAKAYEKGIITKDEYDWLKDYHEKPLETSDLSERASKLLAESGHPVNIVEDKVPFEILNDKDIQNLSSSLNDQVLANAPEQYRTALSDFVINNSIDRLRENPKLLDGVRGYRDFIYEKLADKNRKIQEANHILDKHLLKSVKENMPFSQKELLKNLKHAKFESSHVNQIPLMLPENIKKVMKINEKINKLKVKVKVAKRRGEEPNKQTLRRIEELENSKPKILTPKEELKHLKEKILTPDGLRKNWQQSEPYHRLVDLSHAWHNARTLLDRIHLEARYEEQEAFANLADQVLNMTHSDRGRFADRESVNNYFLARIEGKINRVEETLPTIFEAEKQNQLPAHPDAILKEQESVIDKSSAKEASKEFMEASERYQEMARSEGVLKNFVNCILGGLNG